MKPTFLFLRNLFPKKISTPVQQFGRELGEADLKLAQEINSISSDIDKVLEFEQAQGRANCFVIVNKAKSKAEVYQNGKVVDSFNVGVGEVVGDDLNTSSYKNGAFSKEGKTTPSGQFRTEIPFLDDILNRDEYDSGRGIGIMLLKGVQHPVSYQERTILALHQVPQSHLERIEMIKANNGQRKSVSSGCVNFIPDQFYDFAKELQYQRTNVYILPEERGNKLELVSLPNGLWFKTHYADPEKENIFLQAMKKMFKLD